MSPTTNDRLEHLVRSVIPPATAAKPSHDLWPAIVNRGRVRARVSWVDIGVGAAVAMALLMFPDWLWLLAYHL